MHVGSGGAGKPVRVTNVYFPVYKRRDDKRELRRRGFLAASVDGNATLCVRKRKPIKSSGK